MDTKDDTSKTLSHARRLMKLFEGYMGGYGTYQADNSRTAISRGKVEIKATARTIRKPVTEELWAQHITGAQPLGIMPIRGDNTVLWGCIDIDTYDMSMTDVATSIQKAKLPIVPCKSKSGGVHLFMFAVEPIPAADMRACLSNAAVRLGWGGSEIFPKQNMVHWERGDLGSWLNMPYFDGDNGTRYAIGHDGLGLTLKQFLDRAESLRQPKAFFEQDFNAAEADASMAHVDFGDAPPCMQHLSRVGFPEGTRNAGLLALGVFAKKKFGVQWGSVLERWNRELMDPPLPATEVVDIIRRLEKKDYYYTCKEQPLLAHCNSAVCRTRKYGVGGDDDFPVISGMSVLDTEPPLWFLDVEEDRIELTTEELQNYKSFHRVCMEQLFRCYRMMKQDAWLQIIGDAMRTAVKIEAPTEVGRSGHFYELLSSFLTDRHVGEMRDDLLVGRPYFDEDLQKYFFRLGDLTKYLENSNFRSLSRAQITTRIRRIGGNQHFFNVKGKGVNVWWVPAGVFDRMPEVDTPDLEEDVL